VTQPTSERDRIKQRLAKLLNMTLDNGTSENEAMMAADKAAELMAFYDIEVSELSVRSARAIKQTVRTRKYGNMIIGAPVARHIAQLCDCMYWGSTEDTDKHYTFFGLLADAEIAAYLFDLISNGRNRYLQSQSRLPHVDRDTWPDTRQHLHRRYGRSHLRPARCAAGRETIRHPQGNRAVARCYQSGADRRGLQGRWDKARVVRDQALYRRQRICQRSSGGREGATFLRRRRSAVSKHAYMTRDYQRSACYAWEDRHIHPNDTGTVPFGQAQVIVHYVWRTAGLAHPPKMRPLAPIARTLHATATRLWIRIPKAGIKSTVLLHEIAHSMTSDAFGEHCHHHGPRFVGVFMRLLCDHIPTFSIDALMAAARQEGVEFNFEGSIHVADPSR